MITTETAKPLFSCITCSKPTIYNNGKCQKCYSDSSQKNKKKSEGEEYIADFLKFYNIKFEEQKHINGLYNDTKKFRIADFYLPDYKLYIEYNGMYLDNREHYDEKIKVYKNNKVPCVNLYPENLGVLPFILDKRLIVEMKDKNLKKELVNYKKFKLKKSETQRIYLTVISIVFIIFFLLDYDKGDRGIILLFVAVILCQFYYSYRAYKNIFIHEKHPLDLLKN